MLYRDPMGFTFPLSLPTNLPQVKVGGVGICLLFKRRGFRVSWRFWLINGV